MEFKPKPLADPMSALMRTAQGAGKTAGQRLPMALAETPMRTGPFAFPAEDVAVAKPPRTRQRRGEMSPLFTALALRRNKPGRPPEPR